MKALFKADDLYLIQVEDDLVYYGDGKEHNAFGIDALQFLRFNPYMEDVLEREIEIPKHILEIIKRHDNVVD